MWERSIVNGDYLPSYDILLEPTFSTPGYKRDYDCLQSPMEGESCPEDLPFHTVGRAQRHTPYLYTCPEAQLAEGPVGSLLWAKVDEVSEGNTRNSKVAQDLMCMDVE